jgi:conjugal transfer pilus assembly protein TraD
MSDQASPGIVVARALVWLLGVYAVVLQAGLQQGAVLLMAFGLVPFACRCAGIAVDRCSGQDRARHRPALAEVVRRARARPDMQWLGHGEQWTPARAAGSTLDASRPEANAAWRASQARAIHVPHAVLSSHVLILGQTGSGKTRLASLLATSFIARHPDGALILLDPKGDEGLRTVLRRACEASGRSQSFLELDLARPAQSVRFDPMRNHVRTTSLASRVSALLPDARAGSPFAAFAWRELLVLSDAMLYTSARPTLAALRAAVEGDGRALLGRALEVWSTRAPPAATGAFTRSQCFRAPDRLVAFYRAMVRERPACAEPVIDALIDVVSHDRAHRSKMIQSLLPLMAALTSGELRALLSPAEDPADARPVFDSRKVIDQARVFYVGLDVLSDPVVGGALGSLLLADLAQVAGQRTRVGGAPVLVMIDEAAELAGEPLLQLLNKSRGAGFQLVLAAQTVYDFEARLGGAAMAHALLGNPGNLIALRTSDAGTQRFFTEALPPIDRQERSRSGSMTTRSNSSGAPGAATSGWQARRAQVEWVPPGALSQLPDLHFFARTADGRVWRGALPLLAADA